MVIFKGYLILYILDLGWVSVFAAVSGLTEE